LVTLRKRKLPLIAFVALVLVAIALAVATSGLLVYQQQVPSSGNIVGNSTPKPNTNTGGNIVGSVNIGIYSDVAATVPCSGVDWGTLSRGNVITKTIYVKNTGNVTENISLSASAWSPSTASSALFLTWDKEGYTLPAGYVVPVTLTLTVAEDTGSLSSFSFNIVVSGSG
jgi:hypothetical protein